MSNYLVHHGILGQKWGKKNGPPYPLNESDHSAAEKKAFSEKVGEKRLNNRQESYKKKLNKAQYALSERKRDEATNLHIKSEATKKAQENTERVSKIGKKTINQRLISTLTASSISAGSAFAAITLDTAVPLVGIPASTIAAGYAWYKSYR